MVVLCSWVLLPALFVGYLVVCAVLAAYVSGWLFWVDCGWVCWVYLVLCLGFGLIAFYYFAVVRLVCCRFLVVCCVVLMLRLFWCFIVINAGTC